MSRYRKTMLEALEQVRQQFTEAKKGFNFKGQHIIDPYYDETGRFKVDPKKYYGLSDKQLKDLFKEENDHEVSMARGELEAIADKATQLASMLQSKSDEGNPLEAWVQSKITKAKDYITSVSDYLTYNPDMKQNEELEEGIMSNIATLKSEFQRLDTDYKKMKDEYNAIMAGAYKGDESEVEKKMFKALRSLKDVRQELTSALKTVKEEALDESFTFKQSQSNDAVHKVFYKGKEIGNIFHIHLFGTKPGEKHWAADVLGKAKKMGHVSKIDAAKELLKLKSEELQEARFEVEGRVDYKGISDGDDFSIVVDAPDEKAAEKKVEDMLFTHRNQGKLGPKGGRGVDDYEIESITRTNKSVTNKFSTYQTAEKDLEEAEDYGLKGTITDKQLQNIKSVWSNKTKKDITPGVKTMLAKLDSPTRLAIKMAKINVLSDLVEEINEGFSSSLKQKAKEIAKKFADNMTKAVDEIEKLAKGLSDEPEVYKVIKQYNEDTQRPGPSNPNPKELDEAQSHTVRYTDPLNKKRFAIPYKTHADAEKKMAQLKKDGVKEIEITMDTLKPNIKFKEFKEELEEGLMKDIFKDIFTMDKEGASADDIAKRLKINVNTVKNILGEQKEELSIKKDEKKESDNKQNEIATKDKEIETLKGQVNLLKQKLENEKNKAVKPEPNPKTGEVPLTIGIAHAEFKKQEDKKKEIKEARYEVSSTVTYQGVRGEDEVSVVVDAIDEDDAEANADDMIDDLRRKKKIGPKTGGQVKDVYPFDVERTSKKVGSYEGMMENLSEKIADSIIKDLQKAYGDLKGKTISPEMANKISKHLDQPTYDLSVLRQLKKANIPFISTIARNKIYKKTGKFEEKRLQIESLVALKNKAEKTGMPYNILKQVYDRGMAAWKSGHRPGAGQQQWALARVNSFVTKSSGTWGGADKDLAAKVKGEK